MRPPGRGVSVYPAAGITDSRSKGTAHQIILNLRCVIPFFPLLLFLLSVISVRSVLSQVMLVKKLLLHGFDGVA